MNELTERLQEQFAAEYQPNPDFDLMPNWPTERINTELPPATRRRRGQRRYDSLGKRVEDESK